jgi:hypothetical protein
LSLLYYLFAAKNWGLQDLKVLYEGRVDGGHPGVRRPSGGKTKRGVPVVKKNRPPGTGRAEGL